jgi:hypothetical protein
MSKKKKSKAKYEIKKKKFLPVWTQEGHVSENCFDPFTPEQRNFVGWGTPTLSSAASATGIVPALDHDRPVVRVWTFRTEKSIVELSCDNLPYIFNKGTTNDESEKTKQKLFLDTQ